MFAPASETGDLTYDLACDGAGLAARVAIFAGAQALRAQIAADLAGAGFRTIDGGGLEALIEGPVALLGDVVVVDCPSCAAGGLDAVALAGLARLDMRVARSGARLIVSTDLDGLDDVFAVLDQSAPQILVAPSRAERVIAVGRAMGEVGAARLREMAEEDRIALLRLSQQVEALARSLDRLGAGGLMAGTSTGTSTTGGAGSAAGLMLAEGARAHHEAPGEALAGKFGSSGPVAALPDPRMVRRIIANRQARARFLDPELFGEPAWDMLLDLTAAEGEGKRVSVTSLCIAAGVPATTALRWIAQMVDCGLFVRMPDPGDRRRAFIGLSDKARAAMTAYFASLHAPVREAA